jgi:hypothetical protein
MNSIKQSYLIIIKNLIGHISLLNLIYLMLFIIMVYFFKKEIESIKYSIFIFKQFFHFKILNYFNNYLFKFKLKVKSYFL